jgi:Zn-dependent alcohol dehydrogenase
MIFDGQYRHLDPAQKLSGGTYMAAEAKCMATQWRRPLSVARASNMAPPLLCYRVSLGSPHHTIRTLCPGGKERMRRLMEVIASGRVDTRPLVTHQIKLDQIEEAYDLFANQRDGC